MNEEHTANDNDIHPHELKILINVSLRLLQLGYMKLLDTKLTGFSFTPNPS